MTHKCEISSQATTWLKKSILRRLFVNYYYLSIVRYFLGIKASIVSIYQPHLRPIVRGKAKAKVEFGAKIGASIVNGYTYVDHLSWDAYNESSDLAMQLELYKKRFGMLPQEVQADKLYLGKANRNLIKTRRGPSARGTRWRPNPEPPKGFTGQTTSGRNLTTRLTHG